MSGKRVTFFRECNCVTKTKVNLSQIAKRLRDTLKFLRQKMHYAHIQGWCRVACCTSERL